MAEKRPVQMRTFTGIGRPIDPNYPTNRAIALFALVVIVAVTIWQAFSGAGLLQAIASGLGSGLTVFLAWATCRELDPDHDPSAFVAASLALAGLLIAGLPELGIAFWLLLALRVVNRTTGVKATLFDGLAVLGLGTWLTLQLHWGFAAATALVFWADSRLSHPNEKQVPFALVATGFAGLFALGSRPPEISLALGIALAGWIVFAPVFVAARRLASTADDTGEPLDPERVRTAQAIALLTGLGAALWGGWAGLVALLPLWAAAFGATAFQAVRRFVGR